MKCFGSLKKDEFENIRMIAVGDTAQKSKEIAEAIKNSLMVGCLLADL